MRKTTIKYTITVPTRLYDAINTFKHTVRTVVDSVRAYKTPRPSRGNHGFRKILVPLLLSILIHLLVFSVMYYSF